MLSASVCLALQGRDAKVCKLHLECLACIEIVPEIGISGFYVSLNGADNIHRLEAAIMVKQLQVLEIITESVSVNFDGLKKGESINNRIDAFPLVQRYNSF